MELRAPRVMVVGFDAMDASIAMRLAEEGRMPHLARMLGSATSAAVRNPEGLVVGAVWPSFATGCGPAGHGLYCFRQLTAGRYEIRRFDPRDVDAPPFWDVLSAAGLRCAVLDVPLSRPSDRINGLHVVDWGTHDRMLPPAAVPASQHDEFVARHGHHPIVQRCDHYARRGDWAELLETLRQGVRAHADVALDVMSRERWDLFTVVFSESHCAGHQFWGLHDERNERFDPDLRANLGVDPLENVYEACDAALGDLLEAADAETLVMVLLSHGIGSHHDGDHLLREILDRVERARWKRPAWRRVREMGYRAGGRAVRALRARSAPSGVHAAVAVDGSRRFFQIPNNELHGAIRVNLRGREPRGFVDPGAEYESLLTELETELCALRDPATGRPLVQRVLRTDELHHGPRRSWLPDLLIDWDRSAPITAAASPTIGVVHGRYAGVRSGDHRPSGLVVARGTGITGGVTIGAIPIVDLAPTICAHFGVPMAGVDGTAAIDLLGRDRPFRSSPEFLPESPT